MPVPTLITQLDTAAANNSPPGTESARGNIDDYLRAHASFIRQVFNGAQSGSYAWAGTAGGTANALTLTLTPAITAYSAGQRFVFKSGASANSGVTTAAVSGLTPLAVQVNGAACVGGEILANNWYEVLVDASATSCQLQKIGRATLAELGAAALAGSSSQQFSIANASTAQHAVALAQANTLYAALAGLLTQQFSVADATTAHHAVAYDQVIGLGQTWQELLASRAANTVYTNNTGKPIQVSVYVSIAANVSASLVIDGTIFPSRSTVATSASAATLSAIVPNGSTYQIVNVTGLNNWCELR